MFTTPQETVIFRSRALQVRSYGCETACRRVPTTRLIRWHSLAFMRAGRFVRRWAGRETLIDRTVVGFFNAGQDHVVWHPDLRGDQVTEFEILPEILADIVETNDPSIANPLERPFESLACPIDSPLYHMHWALWSAAMRDGDDDALGVEEAALAMAAHILRMDATRRGVRRDRLRRACTTEAHRRTVDDVRLLLSTRFREPLDLETVARAVHVSPYHLCRVFREVTGTTIQRSLTSLRLRASLGPLADAGQSIARIALDHGFAGQSHYTRQFKRAFGRTPAAVRRTSSVSLVREMSKIVQDQLACCRHSA